MDGDDFVNNYLLVKLSEYYYFEGKIKKKKENSVRKGWV